MTRYNNAEDLIGLQGGCNKSNPFMGILLRIEEIPDYKKGNTPKGLEEQILDPLKMKELIEHTRRHL